MYKFMREQYLSTICLLIISAVAVSSFFTEDRLYPVIEVVDALASDPAGKATSLVTQPISSVATSLTLAKAGNSRLTLANNLKTLDHLIESSAAILSTDIDLNSQLTALQSIQRAEQLLSTIDNQLKSAGFAVEKSTAETDTSARLRANPDTALASPRGLFFPKNSDRAAFTARLKIFQDTLSSTSSK